MRNVHNDFLARMCACGCVSAIICVRVEWHFGLRHEITINIRESMSKGIEEICSKYSLLLQYACISNNNVSLCSSLA